MKTSVKRKIAGAIGWLCMFGMLFVVGGTEQGWLSMNAMWWAFVLMAVGAAALYKAGWIRI